MSFLPNLFVSLKGSRRAKRFLDHSRHRPSNFEDFPRIIWIFWDTGLENAPQLVRDCVASWKERNPGWTVNVLCNETYHKYQDMSDLDKESMHIRIWGNMLRVRLLRDHGGVWADATSFCAIPLEDWLPMLLSSGLFMFSRPGPDRMISNWFIAAFPDHPALHAWDRESISYWRGREICDTYFWHHYLFEYLYRTRREFRDAIRDMPIISADAPHRAQTYLVQCGAEGPSPDVARPNLKGVPIHKLTWKQDIDLSTMRSLLAA